MARHVRTAAGAAFFKKPVGSVITEGEYQSVIAAHSRKGHEAPALPRLQVGDEVRHPFGRGGHSTSRVSGVGDNTVTVSRRGKKSTHPTEAVTFESPAETSNAAALPGGGDDHQALLDARKAARAKYEVGHPERLKAERAVRQSRKSDEYRGTKTTGPSAEPSSVSEPKGQAAAYKVGDTIPGAAFQHTLPVGGGNASHGVVRRVFQNARGSGYVLHVPGSKLANQEHSVFHSELHPVKAVPKGYAADDAREEERRKEEEVPFQPARPAARPNSVGGGRPDIGAPSGSSKKLSPEDAAIMWRAYQSGRIGPRDEYGNPTTNQAALERLRKLATGDNSGHEDYRNAVKQDQAEKAARPNSKNLSPEDAAAMRRAYQVAIRAKGGVRRK